MRKILVKGLAMILVCASFVETLYVSAAEDYNIEYETSENITLQPIEVEETGDVATMSSGSSSGEGSSYYYDTGTSCPKEADYSRYALISILRAGDIIYENDSSSGLTGHVMIVEGIFF